MKELSREKSFTPRDSDAVNRYLNDLESQPLLHAAEEVRLAQLIRQGDRGAEERLVRANLRFVVSVAKKYQHLGLPLADLIAEGNIGLMTAAQRFDATRGFKFVSYAVNWIRQAILSALEEHGRTIRLPRNYTDIHQQVFHGGGRLEQQLERTPTLDELTDYLALSEWKVKEALYTPTSTFSFDRPKGSDEFALLEVLSADTPLPDQALHTDALGLEVQELLGGLNTSERRIMEFSYGLQGQLELSPPEIAKRVHQAPETVRQTQLKILDKLRRSRLLNNLLD